MYEGRRRGRAREAFEHRRRGGRMRRGDIRTALLAVLRDGPGHGYDLIQNGSTKCPDPGVHVH